MKGGKQKCDIEGRDFKEVAKIELLGHLVGHQLGSELVLDEGGEGGEHVESLRHPLLHLVTRIFHVWVMGSSPCLHLCYSLQDIWALSPHLRYLSLRILFTLARSLSTATTPSSRPD